MSTNLIVFDGFYSDPEDMRAAALRMEFDVRGNYPGCRTKAILHDGMRRAIESLVQRPIVYWPEDTYNGAFQITTARDKTWVHADYTTGWAAVVYLTPNAPTCAGTAFYRHRPTGLDLYPDDSETQAICNRHAADTTQWEITDRVANIFNRLVIFNANRFHASESYFGDALDNGRLFQTFFFTTA